MIEPHPLNPNEISAKKLELLKKNIRDFGFFGAILVMPSPTHPGKLRIVDGEKRWIAGAAKELGMDKIPVINLVHLTEEEAQYLLYTMNEFRGEINPLKLAILLQNWRKTSTPDKVFERTGLKRYQQEKLVQRLSPEIKEALKPSRIGHKAFVAVLNAEEHDLVQRALRMTRSYTEEEALVKVCKMYMNCDLRKKVHEERAKVILKGLKEGKALVDLCAHFTTCDDTRAKLREEVKARYAKR